MDFEKMMSKSVSIQFSQTNIKSEKTKVRDLLEENDKMTLLTMDLKEEALKAVNENLKHTESEKSDIQCRLLEEQTKCAELETECSKLRYELCEEQRLHQEIKTELSEIKEETYNMVDEEVEHHRFIEKPQFLEVNEIKKEISQLKIKLLKYLSNTSQAENVHSTTRNSTMKQADAQQVTVTNTVKNSTGGNHLPSRTSVGASVVSGCRKCGNTVSHQPRQSPTKNLFCGKCSKKGHHTFTYLTKAFDVVNRGKLWKVVSETGIKGKLYKNLLAMYRSVKTCVRTSDG